MYTLYADVGVCSTKRNDEVTKKVDEEGDVVWPSAKFVSRGGSYNVYQIFIAKYGNIIGDLRLFKICIFIL